MQHVVEVGQTPVCPNDLYPYVRKVEGKYPEAIKVFYSSVCNSIERAPGGSGIEVKASLHGKEGEETVFRPQLIVGADGLKSAVGRYTGFLLNGMAVDYLTSGQSNPVATKNIGMQLIFFYVYV